MPLRSRLAPVLVAAALTLAACGGDASASGADGPAATAVATATGASGVTATGSFGEKPDVTVPAADPPAERSATVLAEGDGPVVEKGDLLVADYLGQTWTPVEGAENVFDNSYDRGRPSAFPIGTGAVVKGWDAELVGQRVGSRVLLVLPPADGYGEQEQGSIPAGSTLVFVVDVLAAYGADAAASGTPVPDLPEGLPAVTGGAAGKAPTVTVPEGAPAPAEARVAVLVEGDGAPLDTAGTLVAQVHQVSWEGEVVGSTWGSAPTSIPAQQLAPVPGLLEALEGAGAGTRVLAVLPASLTGTTPAVAVFDLLGSY